MPPPTQAPTTSHLESLTRSLITAINTRDFSPSSPAYQAISPGFRAEPSGNFPSSLTLSECLSLLETVTTEHPKHVIEILDINTHVHKKTGRAQVFLNVRMNSPEGTKVRDVGVMEFAYVDETGWKAVRYRGMTGMGQVEAFED